MSDELCLRPIGTDLRWPGTSAPSELAPNACARYDGVMSASTPHQAPGRVGLVERPDGRAEGDNDCGDHIEITLSLRDGRVQRIAVAPRCCLTTLACALAAAALAEGKTPAEALRDVRPEAVAARVDGLPEDHFHCAVLAADTVKRAVTDSLRTAREPWRKLYRT